MGIPLGPRPEPDSQPEERAQPDGGRLGRSRAQKVGLAFTFRLRWPTFRCCCHQHFGKSLILKVPFLFTPILGKSTQDITLLD